MNSRTHINQELQTVAPGLVGVSVIMPYHLPLDYFNGLNANLLSRVKNEEESSEPLSYLTKQNPYTVPQGYFEALPKAVLQRVRSLSLPGDADIWDSLPKSLPYTVPAGFFENFPSIVLHRITKIEKAGEVPAGYFESLPDTLLTKVRKLDTAKELDEIAPLLNTISKQPPHYVPSDYFENLQSNINQPKPTVAPVVKLKQKSIWLKYAAAASVILLLTFGAYFLFNTKPASVPSIANQPTVNVINEQLAKLDASTIENYLKSNNAVTQTALPEGGADELSSGDLDELLQGFTDKQLKEHLDETPDLPAIITPQHHT